MIIVLLYPAILPPSPSLLCSTLSSLARAWLLGSNRTGARADARWTQVLTSFPLPSFPLLLTPTQPLPGPLERTVLMMGGFSFSHRTSTRPRRQYFRLLGRL